MPARRVVVASVPLEQLRHRPRAHGANFRKLQTRAGRGVKVDLYHRRARASADHKHSKDSEPCIRCSGNRNETRNPADWACEIRTRFALQRVCAGIVLYTVSPGRAGTHGVAPRREGLVWRS